MTQASSVCRATNTLPPNVNLELVGKVPRHLATKVLRYLPLGCQINEVPTQLIRRLIFYKTHRLEAIGRLEIYENILIP